MPEKKNYGCFRNKIKAVSLVTFLCVLVLIAPPLSLLFYIRTFGVNVIYADDWGGVSLVQKALNDTLSFSDLFVQHNEHRMPFPNLFMTIIEISTQYNMVAIMFFSWILLCLTLLIIFIVYRKNSRWTNNTRMLLAFLPASLFLFSFRQWESILWAITSQIYLMIFGAVAALALLERSRDLDSWFVLSLICASLASFSFLAGLAVWPVGFFQLVISKWRSALRQLTLWGIASVGIFISYFWGWVKPAYHPPLMYAIAHPIESVEYFFTFLGSPVGDSVLMSEALGLVAFMATILVLVYAQKTKALRNNSLWLSVILFAAFFSFLATVGRSGFGVGQALSSRYTPVTSLGEIGAYFLALSVFEKRLHKSRGWAPHLLLLLITVIIVIACLGGYSEGLVSGEHWRSSREISAYVLSTYKIQSDENIVNYLDADPYMFVRSEAPFLEKNRLNVFSASPVHMSTLTLMQSNTSFEIETINDIPTKGQSMNFAIDSKQCQTLTIAGWAVDRKSGEVASSVFIIIDNNTRIPTIYGLDRPDVVTHLKNPNLEFSGFWATFSSSILVAGKHSVSLEIISVNGKYYYDQNRVLTLVVST